MFEPVGDAAPAEVQPTYLADAGAALRGGGQEILSVDMGGIRAQPSQRKKMCTS
jgi:hypothetical protein